jgi:hypothetical protein
MKTHTTFLLGDTSSDDDDNNNNNKKKSLYHRFFMLEVKRLIFFSLILGKIKFLI